MADFTGYILPSFGDIYYGSMKMSVSSYSLGFIDSANSIANTFTNPTEETKVLNTVIFTNITGGTLSGLAEGKSFAPDEVVNFTIDIPKEGEVVLNGTVTFIFDDDTTYTFTVTGVRAIFWVYRPDDSDYSEGVFYKTVIFKTDSGIEKRRALLTTGLHFVGNTIKKTDMAKLAKIFSLLKISVSGAFTVPLWMNAVPLTAPVNSGGFIANCDTRYVDVGSTGYLIIFKNEEVFDYVPFTSKTTTYFALGSAVVNNYAIGDLVVPVFFGKIKESFPNYNVLDYNYDSVEIKFTEEAV